MAQLTEAAQRGADTRLTAVSPREGLVSVSGGRPGRRVLIVEEGEGLWGAQRYLLRLAPLLEARGFEQVLAAPDDSAIADAWRRSGRAQVHFDVPGDRAIRAAGDEGPVVPRLVAREVGRTAAGARAIAGLARGASADVIHANSHWSHLEGAIAGRLVGLPVVLHLHEETVPGIAGHLRAASIRLADESIAVSKAVAACVPGWARKRVTVIQNGIDTRTFHPGPGDPALRTEMSADPSRPLVLVMCRLDPRKGVDQAIRAVAQLPTEAGVHLAIAGSGSLQPAFAEHLRQLGAELLGDRVRFLGPRNDVAALLRAADLLVLASSLEGLPLGILEAHACGTPVVAYPAAAGVPEVIHHGETGLLARHGDIADLSACIARLVREPRLRERISVAARDQVTSQFTLDIQADRQAALLRDLFTGRRGRRRAQERERA